MLSPEAISRAVDLIRLGPLSFQFEDVELEDAGIAMPFTSVYPSCNSMLHAIQKEMQQGRHYESVRFGSGFLVNATLKARNVLYDEHGSIQRRHWFKSGVPFAQYMTGDYIADSEELKTSA